MKKYLWPIIALVGMIALAACDSSGNSTSTEHNQVESQQQLYVNDQPPPFFNWSLERHIMVETYKARNNAVVTYSYVRSNYTGKVLFSCPSIGYPIPYSTQLTNPNSIQWQQSGGGTWEYSVLPQPEPNGLYPPATAEGTWVFCTVGGDVTPVYEEPNVETYPMPMKEVADGHGNFTLVPDGASNLKISPKK